MGSILSEIMGGGSSPGQDAQMGGLKAAQEDLAAYRPEAMAARRNLLSSASTAYQGMNNALETLWGKKPATPGNPSEAFHGAYGPPPVRMMGHDMPQNFPPPMTSGQASAADGHYTKPGFDRDAFLESLVDPANIFGVR